MTSKLPLEVLGLMSPILSWVERSDETRYPDHWIGHQLPSEARERAWLVRELPTYSEDTLEEILQRARGSEWNDSGIQLNQRLRRYHGLRDSPLSPPPGYVLSNVFRRLSHRYFEWRGSDLYVRQGRLEELHELAMRFPVSHLIRHSQSEAVAAGMLSKDRALELPAQLSHLHTTSQGFRTVMERGVTEGHLHLWGVLNPDEVWADHLLKALSPGILRKFSQEDRRLLLLSRFAVHLMALSALAQKSSPPEAHPPFRLIPLLDQLYFARHPAEEKRIATRLKDEIRSIYLSSHLALLLDEPIRLLLQADDRAQADTALRRLRKHLSAAGFSAQETTTLLSPVHERIDELFDGDSDHDSEARHGVLKALGHLRGELFRMGPRRGVPRLRIPRRELYWLLRLAAPASHRIRLLQHRSLYPGKLDSRFEEETVRDRLQLLARLHLTVQRLLLEPSGSESQREESRELLHQIYFRYLVYQTHHWQLGAQSGRTTGLRYFKNFMEARQRDTLVQNRLELQGLIFERLGKSADLHTVEGRISPPTSPDDVTPWVLGYAKAAEQGELDAFGLVVHFVKSERGKAEGETTRIGNRVVRYGRIRRITKEKALSLYRLLSRSHPAIPFIVGIDAANLELTTPPEVFAPAFRFLRELPIEPRTPNTPWSRFGTHFEVSSLLKERTLGLTYHVGEDFRHLLSGLRAIGEVLEFLAPRPGDRLGHAIALALDPEVWCRQTGYQAILPKIEWLDTLVWVYNLLGPSERVVGELGLKDRIQRLARDVYGTCELPGARNDASEEPQLEREWSPLTLHHAWKLRQLDPYSLKLREALRGEPAIDEKISTGSQHRRWAHVQRKVLREVHDEAGSRASFHLLSLYWLHENARTEGAKLTRVDMKKDEEKELWLRLCRDVQARMKDRVSRRELVVEVNPSSNRLVGPLGSFEHHHIFDLTLNEDRILDPKLRVTVNTDDPGVFSTSLPHEFYLLGEILTDRWKVPEPEVERWLEWLRQNGEDSSFVRYLPDTDDPRIGKILESLRRENENLTERMAGSRRYHHFWNQFSERRRHYRRKQIQEILRTRPHVHHELERRLGALEREMFGEANPDPVPGDALERLAERLTRTESSS